MTLKLQRSLSKTQRDKLSGGYTGEVTPDPIPNSEVKLAWADNTTGLPLWERRSLPDLFKKPLGFISRGLFNV